MTDSQSNTAADRLSDEVADVHVPEPSADSESRLLKVAFALPVVGVLLILAAWCRPPAPSTSPTRCRC